MNSNFQSYSRYYDLMYADKDYRSEAGYISRHLKSHVTDARHLLELGCGTGNYAKYLSNEGFDITGLDSSSEMVDLALRKGIPNFTPCVQDIRSFNLNRKFDAAVSLFHVICYLTTNAELLSCFASVSAHLRMGGVFAFDLWYGPAVLHELPTTRIKRRQNDAIAVTRLAETNMQVNRNVAEVNYEIFVKNRQNGQYATFVEKHPMRYFFLPEIDMLADLAGFRVVLAEAFMSAQVPDMNSWNVFILLEKIK